MTAPLFIAADHILIDHDTALWVPPPGPEPSNDWPGWDDWDPADGPFWKTFARPCDTCGELPLTKLTETSYLMRGCPDCDGTGRLTLKIGVECTGPVHRSDRPCPNWCAHGVLHHRVSVTDVLPVYGHDPGDWPDMLTADQPCVVIKNDRTAVLWDGAGDFTDIKLPPAASPGDQVVKLTVMV